MLVFNFGSGYKGIEGTDESTARTVRTRSPRSGDTPSLTKRLFIKTYGCQMNVYDSARMADVLAPLGYRPWPRLDGADMVILNTCHIREKAAEKVYSELGRVRQIKQARAEARGERPLIVAVAGCVAQAEGEEILRRAPYVDIVFGPQTYHRLPEMVARARRAGGEPVIGLGPEHDVDEGRAFEDFLALGLGDAASDRDQGLGGPLGGPAFLDPPQPAKLGIDLLRRLLADMAGVEDDQVGIVGPVRLGVTERRQDVCHARGVVDVHLAAVCFDEELFAHRHDRTVMAAVLEPLCMDLLSESPLVKGLKILSESRGSTIPR